MPSEVEEDGNPKVSSQAEDEWVLCKRNNDAQRKHRNQNSGPPEENQPP